MLDPMAGQLPRAEKVNNQVNHKKNNPYHECKDNKCNRRRVSRVGCKVFFTGFQGYPDTTTDHGNQRDDAKNDSNQVMFENGHTVL